VARVITKADFAGKYHLFHCKSEFPVPGTALAVDAGLKRQKEVRDVTGAAGRATLGL
jgi:hypothetical protein